MHEVKNWLVFKAWNVNCKSFYLHSVGIDLALLSLGNHTILTYGTFGMWGALLAGGEAILPSSHTRTKEHKEIAAANIPGWKII